MLSDTCAPCAGTSTTLNLMLNFVVLHACLVILRCAVVLFLCFSFMVECFVVLTIYFSLVFISFSALFVKRYSLFLCWFVIIKVLNLPEGFGGEVVKEEQKLPS